MASMALFAGRSTAALDFVAVMDVEATCEAGNRSFPHEVIELPVVIVDVRQPLTASRLHNADRLPGTVAAVFQTYIRPHENATLSAFCKELTGIQQDWVDAAPDLRTAIRELDRWLRRTLLTLKAAPPHSVRAGVLSDGSIERFTPSVVAAMEAGCSTADGPAHDHADEDAATAAGRAGDEARGDDESLPPFAFLTDGPWDIKHFLHAELHRKGLLPELWPRDPPYWDGWVNVRWLFAETLGGGRRGNVEHMLRELGLRFQGREHSGLDDSVNIARIARSLCANGISLRINDGIGDDMAVMWHRRPEADAATTTTPPAAVVSTDVAASPSPPSRDWRSIVPLIGSAAHRRATSPAAPSPATGAGEVGPPPRTPDDGRTRSEVVSPDSTTTTTTTASSRTSRSSGSRRGANSNNPFGALQPSPSSSSSSSSASSHSASKRRSRRHRRAGPEAGTLSVAEGGASPEVPAGSVAALATVGEGGGWHSAGRRHRRGRESKVASAARD